MDALCEPLRDPGENSLVSVAKAEDGHNASNRINVAAMPAGLPVADIRIACSKGTYIRSFARDIGEKLNSGAFLASLCRSRSGEFRVENAISVTDAVTRLHEFF